MTAEYKIAYFSMEIGLDSAIPTYSGGLGVLAGDTIRSAADLKVPLVAVTLLHRKGYFFQKLDDTGWQVEEPATWSIEDYLTEMRARTTVTLEGRTVLLRAFRYIVTGVGGFEIPVIFLDSDLPENSEWDRTLTDFLYGGDSHYRICQEVILGIGGVRMLRVLGFNGITRFHMNEGHASLLTVELLKERAAHSGKRTPDLADVEAVREMCVFTTHTPVPAGHDKFPMDLVKQVLGACPVLAMTELLCFEGLVNMTYMALNLSTYVNGVAEKHGEVSRHMFAGYSVDSITNGVHVPTWTSPPFQELFDRFISGWREDSFSLRYALSISRDEIWEAHMSAKRDLIQYVNREINAGMDFDVLTMGYARRATAYKRPELLFTDIARLKSIAARAGTLQVVYSGKAHPNDQAGKKIIQHIHQMRDALKPEVMVVYLENYDMDLGRLITAGVDIWLNTPQPPLEASGTSGMKAAINGVPSFSILDGWWIEGCIEGVTGWSIGTDAEGTGERNDQADAEALYDKLENVIIPQFTAHRGSFIDVMRHAIALNGSFFNTQRMMQQYVLKAYFG